MGNQLVPSSRGALRQLNGVDPLASRMPVRVQRAVDREAASDLRKSCCGWG